MRKRFALVALLLMSVLLLSSCGKMSDEQAIAAMRESDELWINYGLAAWEAGTETEDVSGILSGGYKYLYLHNYMFTYDEEKSAAVAEDFFRFVADKYGLAAVLDTDKRVAYKTEYLHSLGFEFDYASSTEEENFFRTVTFHSDDVYDYIFTYKNASFTFTDFEVFSLDDMQSMVFDTCTFLDNFAAYVKKKNLSYYFNTDSRVCFHCEGIGRTTTVSYTRPSTGMIYMRSRWSLPHEYVHAVSNFSHGMTGSNTFLDEFVANYFPYILELTDMHKKQNYIRFVDAEAGYYEDQIAQGGAVASKAKYFQSLWENYVALGGTYETAGEIDTELFYQAALITGRTSGSSLSSTLYESYLSTSPNMSPFEGGELLNDEFDLFGSWLIEKYGLLKVFETWRTADFSGTLGEDYETIKAEWMEAEAQYLKQAGF